MKAKVVVITGSRDMADPAMVYRVLNMINPDFVLHGGCPTGADEFANEWALWSAGRSRAVIFHPDWDSNGKAAGPIRNRGMAAAARKYLDEGAEVRAYAFPEGKSPGTRNCIDELAKAGVAVNVWESGAWSLREGAEMDRLAAKKAGKS